MVAVTANQLLIGHGWVIFPRSPRDQKYVRVDNQGDLSFWLRLRSRKDRGKFLFDLAQWKSDPYVMDATSTG